MKSLNVWFGDVNIGQDFIDSIDLMGCTLLFGGLLHCVTQSLQDMWRSKSMTVPIPFEVCLICHHWDMRTCVPVPTRDVRKPLEPSEEHQGHSQT